MAVKSKATKIKILSFNDKLILNQWLINLFGFNAESKYGNDRYKKHSIQDLAKILKDTPEGMGADNLHHFYKEFNIHLGNNSSVTPEQLIRYEHNIVSHSLAINAKRERPITWKYYQWLSLLFSEIYLDYFFNKKDILQKELNSYVDNFNTYWEAQGFVTGITHYSIEDLNKICLQNATGSGKTLLMQINFLQFRQYANRSRLKHDLTRTLLITPNEDLSRQLDREFRASGIYAQRLLTDSNDLFSSDKNSFRQIDYTEIHKLKDVDGPNIIAVRNLGDQNLLLVDEAHRGMGSNEERGWFKSRERLAEKGFVFEYSATFKEAVTAAKDTDIENVYAKSILFDYSYHYFYEDGYGKDYRIFNLPRTYDQLQFSYLTACLLSFYQQLKLYTDKETLYKPYNLEKPLWVFVGSTVTGGAITKLEKDTFSDVASVLKFYADFISNEEKSAAEIQKLLTQNGKASGLIDNSGHDIFAGSFLYLREIMLKQQLSYLDLLKDIFEKVFQNKFGGHLTLARIKGNTNEILLRIGQADISFGLINVGDASGLVKHIEEKNLQNLFILESEFSDTLFSRLHLSNSPINILIGSKKFIEGWDCWRVSTLGLMHVGKSEGSQIIQLFGRGVRLKGHAWSLKRSSSATPTHQPEFIQYLETLNVFGIEADFMERFKKFLEAESLPGNDQKTVYKIPLTITYDFGKKLKVLRPRKKSSSEQEYNFKRDGAVPSLGEIPEKLRSKTIIIDWYPRIASIASKQSEQFVTKNATVFKDYQLIFLNYDEIYFRLEKFKHERSWHNFNIEKSKLQKLLLDASWYILYIPSEKMDETNFQNIFLWQELACELLQKYCEEYYNYCKAAFIEPRLVLDTLKETDDYLPQESEYQLIVNSDEQTLINDILNLEKDIMRNKQSILEIGSLKACLFANHLYQPVMHASKEARIKIAPVSLNENEFQFLQDLKKFVDQSAKELKTSSTEVFLLRNESRGKGIGFFEAGNFYPDFLLWQVKNGKQYLAFIEPHGLLHEGPASRKIEFHKTIKDIQHRVNSTNGNNIILNSFIISTTRLSKLSWGLSLDELANKHIYFMGEQKDYIFQLLNRMLY